MKPFSHLTEKGQARRLRQLALKALTHYDLSIKNVRFLDIATNAHFRLETTDGQKYVIRVCQPGEHSLDDNRAEIAWLTALIRDTDLNVVEPVANKNGEYATIVEVEGVPEPRRCNIFRWIPGKTLSDDGLTPDNYRKLGLVAAKLHKHAEHFAWPLDYKPMRWDRVFYYPDEPVIMFNNEFRDLITPNRRKLIERGMEKAEAVFADLYANPGQAMVIHGDLHYWNVHVHRGRLYVLDFEDLMWGYPIQDVAITLSYGNTRDGYAELEAAFREGYTALLPWPETSEGQMATLQRARGIMFINYVLRIEDDPKEQADYVAWQCGLLADFLATYQ